jgi:hypothetical protein
MDKEQIILWAIKAHMEASAADDNCRVPHFDDVTLEELEAFAKLVATHERNKLAAWMTQFGFATGHGDTMEQLCDALGTEIVDRIDGEVEAEREACAKVAKQHSHRDDDMGAIIERAIRARGETK